MTEQVSPGSQLRQLEELMLYPREDLNIEIKSWLELRNNEDKANLAQAMLALANHGGGFIIIGMKEDGGEWIPDDNMPSDMNIYNQDTINNIVLAYAEPAFHCQLHIIKHRKTDQLFPVIVIPGGHKVPIRAKKDGPERKHVRQNTYYIRKPGPKSEEPHTAQEWDQLINRCIRANREYLVDQIRDIIFGFRQEPTSETTGKAFDIFIEQAMNRWRMLVAEQLQDETPNRYHYGVWTCAYQITGNVRDYSLAEFKDILDNVGGHHTGWPPWWVPNNPSIAPYPFENLIECWLKDTLLADAATSDFWRASREGMMFLLRGYQEDCEAETWDPGTFFDLTLPIWRIGECLLHAEQLSNIITLEENPLIRFRVTWSGLQGRELRAWASHRRFLHPGRVARQDSVTSEIVVETGSISTLLPEIVQSITQPLYELFDFFNPSLQIFQEELSWMRKEIR